MAKHPTTKPSRVLGYARVSSEEQALGTSLADQQNVIREEAARRGVEDVRFFVEAESGIRAKEERRERMTALLRELRPGDLVLCDKIDRWSRDTEFTLRTTREIDDAGATWFAVHERCDSKSEGRFMLTMRAAVAADEHARIKVRTVGTRKILRNAGLYSEGLAPLGYVRSLPRGSRGSEKNVLRVEPEGAKIVRRIFALSIAGKSLTEIGVATEQSRDRVFSILNCRTYRGEIQNTDGVWIKAKHEALIDASTWTRASEALKARRNGAKPSGAPAETSDWILRDVALCTCGARLGAAYAGPKGEGRRHYYRCSRKCGLPHVPVRIVEAEAEPLILARLVSLREQLARPAAPVKAKPANDTSAQRAKLAKRRDAFLEQHAEGLIDTATLRTKLAAADEQMMKLDAEDSEARATPRLAEQSARVELLRKVEGIEKRWRKAKPATRRQIVNLLAVDMRLEARRKPVPAWRSDEDLAAERE